MKKLEIEEIKLIELGIMRNIHMFCEEHHLRYGLWGGTLLGAIRHNGYIPWDDDIDIYMPRKDYNVFIHNFKADHYKVFSCHTDSEYPYTFAKVVDLRTVKIEQVTSSCGMTLGVDVDVFPVDTFENKYTVQKTVSRRKLYRYLWQGKISEYGNAKKIRDYVRSIVIFFSKKIIKENANRIALKINELGINYGSVDRGYVYYADLNARNPLYFENEWIDKRVLHKFEQDMFYIPEGYDPLLKLCFGDYMQLPPPEKRVTHHSFEVYRIE